MDRPAAVVAGALHDHAPRLRDAERIERLLDQCRAVVWTGVAAETQVDDERTLASHLGREIDGLEQAHRVADVLRADRAGGEVHEDELGPRCDASGPAARRAGGDIEDVRAVGPLRVGVEVRGVVVEVGERIGARQRAIDAAPRQDAPVAEAMTCAAAGRALIPKREQPRATVGTLEVGVGDVEPPIDHRDDSAATDGADARVATRQPARRRRSNERARRRLGADRSRRLEAVHRRVLAQRLERVARDPRRDDVAEARHHPDVRRQLAARRDTDQHRDRRAPASLHLRPQPRIHRASRCATSPRPRVA